MAVQVSHRIYPEIPETAAIRSSEETSRGAEIGGLERGGVHQGQECDSRGEALFEKRAKLGWAADLGPRFFR